MVRITKGSTLRKVSFVAGGPEAGHFGSARFLFSPVDKIQTGLYTWNMSRTSAKSDARTRILETADRLFYAEGVRSVGIDRIIAEAGVAKMTLYNHFPSKDELILAVLKYREAEFDDFFQAAIEKRVKSGMDRLRAFFAALKAWFDGPNFRGCSFINASVELADPKHPASQFATQHKCRFRKMLEEIVVESAGRRAAPLVDAISLLVEGAIVTAVMESSSRPADVARDAAMKLIAKAKKK